MGKNKVTIDVEARFVDNVSGKTASAKRSVDEIGKAADTAQKKINNIGKGKKASVDADDSKFLKKIRAIETKLYKLGGEKVLPVIDATDRASKIIDKVLGKVKKFAGATYRAAIAVRDSNALATIRKITEGGEKLSRKTWQTAVKIKDYATAPLTKIKNTLFSIKSLVLAITAGLAAKQFIVDPINLADAYSSANIGFSTLLGESQGQQLMDELDTFAKETPFKASQVIAQTQRMLAMGWDVDNIIEDMETIGDAAAATGKGEMGLEQIVLALSQIKTKGRLSTEELNQLAEAGISAKAYLAEGLGYGTGDEGIAKMTKDLENGAIASGVALEALLSGMKEYQGMMDRTANETVSGLWSQVEDTFEINIARRWGQGLQDGMKKTFGSIVTIIDESDSALQEFGDTLYEIGSNISNWTAERLENAVKRITEITDSFEFKNASLGEKISMLWKGVVTDPLREWWEGGGQEKTARTAGEIGSWLGKTLSNGILTILGATDILDDSNLGESGGANVAQSFVKGFVDNFDASAIAAKIVDAIGNVWGALPWWGKLLVGGYAGGKIASGLGNVVGGIGNIIGGVKSMRGLIGSTGNAMVGGSGILGSLASAGYTFTGGAAGSSLAGGTAALVGGGTILGGVAAGAASIKGAYDISKAVKAMEAGDLTEAKANAASGGSALGGVAAGAAIGSLILPGVGTLIGAGIGGLAGWLIGDKWADSIREAKYETEEMKAAINDADMSSEELAQTFEKAVWQNMKDHFGDIALSMSEIERLADQIVWGDQLGNFETFNTSTKAAEESLNSLKAAAADTERWMWKANLGVTFNEDEIESITESFDAYISSAQSYLDNKHYEFTAAVSMLIDPQSESGKSILESGNEYFMGLQEQLNTLGSELSNTLKISLSDGIIDIDEAAEIANLQQQIADIIQKVSEAEQAAQFDLIKLKFGGGNIDSESFNSLMAQIQTTIDERMQASDEAFVVAVSGLKMQLEDGAISEDEYNSQVSALAEQYGATVDSLKADVMSIELDIIDDAYGDILGEDAKAKMSQAISDSLAQGIDPIQWTTEQAQQFLGVESLTGEVAGALSQMLGQVAQQISSMEIDTSAFTSKLQASIPNPIALDTQANVNANYDVVNKFLGEATEFDVKEKYDFDTKTDVNPTYKVTSLFNGKMSDFGIKSSYTVSPTINISPIFKGNTTYDGPSARGGIYGADIPGYSDGGIVRGGARLITVAEEGSPEMVIPLSSQRRGRALKLWAQAGHMMDVPGFARGGLTSGGQDEGIRFFGDQSADADAGRSGEVVVEVGGVQVEINVDATGGQNIADAIRAQGGEIAETVAGILADAFSAQFENTPTKGGAA